MAKRYLDKFTSQDGTSFVYTFPTRRYEAQVSQPLISPRARVSGMDYSVRLLGDARSLRAPAQVRVRGVYAAAGTAQDAEIDDARQQLYLGKQGYLWTLDDQNNRRKALAELTEMPEISVNYLEPGFLPLVFGFVLDSDFFDEDGISSLATISASPATITVNNPGNLPASRMTIRLRANGSAGFSGTPTLTNTSAFSEGTVPYQFKTARAAVSANSEVRLDTRRPAVEYSNDDGSSYTDDFANYILPPSSQKLLSFQFEAGNNSLVVTCGGSPNFVLQIEGDAPYA